jgi:urease accessory protein
MPRRPRADGQQAEPPAQQNETAEAPVGSPALYRLLTWLSPAYPVGAFAYSSGIEWAVEAGDVRDAETLKGWLATILSDGGGFCDAVFFVHAHGATATRNEASLRATAELGCALASSKERFLETTATGRAFIDATRASWPCVAFDWFATVWDGPVCYPVAVGVAAAGHGIALEISLTAYLHAIMTNLVSAGVRLIPLGQTDGLRVMASLEAVIAAAATRALACPLDDIGSCAFRADMASMHHETQYTRLFRS